MLFPTSVIGSLPRPRFVKDLIADDSPLPEPEYRRLMGEAIRSAVALQEMAGLDVITDGEWWRKSYIGVAKFSKAGAAKLRDYYHRAERNFAGKPWREAVVFEKAYKILLFQEMIERGESFTHIDTPGGYIEVDTQQDFEYAREHWTGRHLRV